MELYFEWDEEKAKTNLNKHGVSFEMTKRTAMGTRIDLLQLEWREKVLFVVYMERQPNIRLISARLANARERRLYYGIV